MSLFVYLYVLFVINISKANNSLRFIRRNVKTPNKKIKATAYKTYVRHQVEYCSIVWHPWQKYLIYKIDQVLDIFLMTMTIQVVSQK
jgi:hypothetical protein